MEELKKKLHTMILKMESEPRKICGLFPNWGITSSSLFLEAFNKTDSCIFQKGKRYICFQIIHEKGCNIFQCSCTKELENPIIHVYYLSDLFAKMISVSHIQFSFLGDWTPKVLSNITDGLKVVYRIIPSCDYEDLEKEKSLDFQRMRNEFNSLICEYLMLAFTDPTSLPRFLLDSDEGPTMRLSELIAWLEESK